MASRLLARCAEASGCEHFGLLLGQRTGPSYLGLPGFLAHTASTVGQALEALTEYLDLHDEGGIVSIDREGDYCSFSYRVLQPGAAAVDQIYDLFATEFHMLMRGLCGQRWTSSEVLLPRRKPHDVSPYRAFFRTTLLFDSDTCNVLFPCHALDKKLSSADDYLYEHLKAEADALHGARTIDTVDTLPAALQRGLLLQRFSAREVADAVGLHERTLHRRLQSAGTSFRQELDRVRESLSTQLLETTSLPVCDIAVSLGYSDSSGFIRAFRRWTGHSPTEWRKRNRLS
jgi:AraC-like DNA-binding protein